MILEYYHKRGSLLVKLFQLEPINTLNFDLEEVNKLRSTLEEVKHSQASSHSEIKSNATLSWRRETLEAISLPP